jgi:hypothetical protein
VTIGILQDENNVITNVQTDSSGRFQLDIDYLKGIARIVISAMDKKGIFMGRLLMDSLIYSPAKVLEYKSDTILTVREDQLADETFVLLQKTDEVKKSVKRKYTLSDTILIDEVRIYGRRNETPQEIRINTSRMVYGLPDKEVIITPQLESMRSIRDLLMGRVSGIMFVKPPSRGDSGIRIRGSGSSIEMGSEPLFLLDGLIVTYDVLSSVPLNWIDRVDVIKSVMAAGFGVRGANGIISVITKTAEDIPYKPVSYSVNTKISGYDTPRIFYSPKHDTTKQKSYMPDLRSTLYWLPDIKVVTNQDYLLKYFNADISSTYKITVEGITSDGIPVTGKAEYEVK